MQITLTDTVSSKDLDEIRLGLNAWNSQFYDADLIKPLGCSSAMRRAGNWPD